MLTILSEAPAVRTSENPAQPRPSAAPPAELRVEQFEEQPHVEQEKEEFEFVVGTRQLAGLAFVAIAAIALFSAISYMTGKAASEIAPEPIPALQIKLPQPPPPQLSVGDQFAAYAASLPAKAPEKPAVGLAQAPLIGEPQAGMTYIQMAAVEKAVAGVFVEGLRTHGLPSFAAAAPNSNIFRVLIGPLPDPAAYQKAKAEVDKMGLSTFARQYEK